MNSATQSSSQVVSDPRCDEALPLSAARRIDRECERFEKALRTAQPAAIEDHLDRTSARERAALLRELLAIELEYRTRRGERPTEAEYAARFPDNAQLVSLVFGEAQPEDAVPPFLVDHPRYRVVRLLGRGGMGTVYLAEHRDLRRAVALKIIQPGLLADEAVVERFRSEARAAASLNHPHIVAVYDAETAGEGHFLVMEHVQGTDLARAALRDGPLPVSLACEYIRQASLGLQHAHEHGMVHRDITPRNLMLAENGQIKILDFGLAHFVSEARPAETHASITLEAAPGSADFSPHESRPAIARTKVRATVLGSIDYMAPEQAANPHDADIRADIYSLGCTLHFLLTGKPPFAGGSLDERIKAHATEPPPKIETIRADAPAELSVILDRMLAKDRADRFQTPAEVAIAIAPLADGNPRRPSWSPGARTAAAAFIGLLLSVAIVGAWIAAHSPSNQPASESPEQAEATRLYREGERLIGQRKESQARAAIKRLESATAIKPDFALGQTALADAYNLCGDYGWEMADQVFPKAETAARRAIAIDPSLAEAHLALAFTLSAYDCNWRRAEAEYRAAIELNPRLANAHHWYAWFLAERGRTTEATREIEKARELAPDDLIIVNNVGKLRYLARDYAAAVERHKYALELDPDFRKAHRDLALAYAELGPARLNDALAELKQAEGLTDDGRDLRALRAYAYARNGQPAQVRPLLAQLEPLAKEKPLAYEIATIYAAAPASGIRPSAGSAGPSTNIRPPEPECKSIPVWTASGPIRGLGDCCGRPVWPNSGGAILQHRAEIS